MKKIALMILGAVLFTSCGPSAILKEARATFKDDWNLSSITFPGSSENLNVILFDDTTVECFRNSDWVFIPNNNTGSYELTSPGCDQDTRFFIWSIDEVNAETGEYNLLLKPTDADYESISGNKGYRLDLVKVAGTNMIWEETVTFEGEPFTIRMNFTKNIE